MTYLLFLWWSVHPSLQLRLYRRTSPIWPDGYRKMYLSVVWADMSAAERAYVHWKGWET